MRYQIPALVIDISTLPTIGGSAIPIATAAYLEISCVAMLVIVCQYKYISCTPTIVIVVA